MAGNGYFHRGGYLDDLLMENGGLNEFYGVGVGFFSNYRFCYYH